MTRTRMVLAAAGGIALAVSASGAAHAVPAYAYSQLSFTNFTLGNVIGNSNITVNSSTVLGTDSANYPGSAPASNASNGSLTSGTDTAEASAGPSTAPQNTFTQFYLPASALTPAGTRGDTQITGAIASGATSNLVSEGKLSVPGSNAGSSSGTSTTLNTTVTVGASAQAVTLTFTASDSLMAMVGTNGDSANAQDSATFKIVNTATGASVFITDNINSANSGTTIAPTALNQNVATTVASTPQSFTSPSTAYSYTATLAAGQTYQISLQDSTTVILATATPVPVPEPASLTLLGSGLVAFGLVRSRRKRKV